jgi:hypothetical protein
MILLIKACLIKEDFTMAAMVIGGENLGYNFQKDRFHGFLLVKVQLKITSDG